MFESTPSVPVEGGLMADAGAVFALTSADLLGADLTTAEEVVVMTQRLINALTARQDAALDTMLAAEGDRLAGEAEETATYVGCHGGDDPVPEVAARVAPLLRIAPATAAARLARLRHGQALLPRTCAMAWRGELEPARVAAITRASRSLDLDVVDDFEARVHAGGIAQMPVARLRARAQRIADACSVGDAGRRADRSVSRRKVGVTSGDDPFLAVWRAELPSAVSARMWAAIDELGRRYRADDPTLRIDQARADALADLVLGQVSVTTRVDLLVPVDAVNVARSDPPDAGGRARSGASAMSPALTVGPSVEIPRCGWLVPEEVVGLLRCPDTQIRFARYLRDTGELIDVNPTVYRPGARLAAAVRLRDGTCRFPGCSVAAARCDLDHVTPFPTGPTTATNLLTLCRTHHRVKHRGTWDLALALDGTATWTVRATGRTHSTRAALVERHRTAAA